MSRRIKPNLMSDFEDPKMIQLSSNNPKSKASYRKPKFSPNQNLLKSRLRTGKTTTNAQVAVSTNSILNINNRSRNSFKDSELDNVTESERKENDKKWVAGPKKSLQKDKFDLPVVHNRDDSLMTLLEPESTLAVKKKEDVIQNHFQFLFKDKKMCDLDIKNKEKSYKIHSFALTMHSDRYKTMFTDVSARPPTEILISCLNNETVEKVLEYMYTFNIKLDEHCLESVLDLSEQLDMKMLTKKCSEFMLHFDKDNVLKYIMISKKHNFRGLLAKYVEFARKNFSKVSALSEFLNLNFEDVKTIIQHDESQSWTRKNISILRAVVQWTKADALSRNALLPRLFEKVWFDQIKPKKLQECIGSAQFVLEIPECLYILRKAYRYHAMTKNIVSDAHPTGIKEQKWKENLARGIFVIGGLVDQQLPYSQGNKVWHYSLCDDGLGVKAETWTELEPLPSRRCGHCAVILNSQLYVIGGSIHEADALLPVPTNTVLRYNVLLQMWDAVAAMKQARSDFAACEANGLIYVFGGETETYCPTDIVEYYCPLKNLWFMVCPMPVGRSSHAACPHEDGNVLVVGGCIDNLVLNFVDVYNVNVNRWQSRSRFPEKICRGTLVSVSKHIVYMGGVKFQENEILTSSEGVYEFDDKNDIWKPVGKMKFPRHFGAAANFGDTIYFIGGFSTCTWTTTAQVTSFHVPTYHFKDAIPDLPSPLMNFAAIAHE